MKEKTLTTPIRDEDLESLEIGDIVYLDGALITCRDDVHQRVVKHGRTLPVDLAGKAIFHAGPIMRQRTDGSGKYDVISIGPTTSMRMEKYEKEFLAKTGVKLIVGKGGMGDKTAGACREYKAVHAVFPGGCAVLAAQEVEEVEQLLWPELGMPEAIWVMRVKHFGPLLISIDTKGRNLFEANKKDFRAREEKILPEIYKTVDYIQ